MGKGAAVMQSDMARTLNGALAAAIESTTTAERERDRLGKELEAERARNSTLQSGLAQAAKTMTGLQTSLTEERAAAVATASSLEACQAELEAQTQKTKKLDQELWRNAEMQLSVSTRVHDMQHKLTAAQGDASRLAAELEQERQQRGAREHALREEAEGRMAEQREEAERTLAEQREEAEQTLAEQRTTFSEEQDVMLAEIAELETSTAAAVEEAAAAVRAAAEEAEWAREQSLRRQETAVATAEAAATKPEEPAGGHDTLSFVPDSPSVECNWVTLGDGDAFGGSGNAFGGSAGGDAFGDAFAVDANWGAADSSSCAVGTEPASASSVAGVRAADESTLQAKLQAERDAHASTRLRLEAIESSESSLRAHLVETKLRLAMTDLEKEQARGTKRNGARARAASGASFMFTPNHHRSTFVAPPSRLTSSGVQ